MFFVICICIIVYNLIYITIVLLAITDYLYIIINIINTISCIITWIVIAVLLQFPLHTNTMIIIMFFNFLIILLQLMICIQHIHTVIFTIFFTIVINTTSTTTIINIVLY